MGTLPTAARWYVALVLALGGAGLALRVCAVGVQPSWELALAVALAAVLGTRKLVLLGGPKAAASRASGMTTLSLGFPVVFGSLLWFGAEAGAVVGVASALGGSLLPRGKPRGQVAFNAVTVGLCALASGMLMVSLSASPGRLLPPEPLPLLAGTLLYCALNTALVAVVVALSRRQPVRAIWRDIFTWTAPSYLVGAVLVVTTQALYATCGPIVTGLSLLCLYLVHHSYRTYFEKAHQLAESEQRLEQVCLAVVRSLAEAIDARDSAAINRVHRAQMLSIALAEKIGVTGDELQAIRVAGLTYDVGKLAVPDTILWKAGPLSPEEFERVKTHVDIGVSILEPVQFPWPVLPIVRSHHERWDGRGYPAGLKGEQIPIGGRIVAIADVFDALTSRRPYRSALTPEEALDAIRAGSGTQFDPLLVEALCELFPVLRPTLDDPVSRTEGPGTPKSEPERSAHVWNEIQQATLQSRSLAYVDALTGVGNARHLEAALTRELEIAWRLSRPCSVLVMDLDGFKVINDTLGHLAGDFALQWVAQVLQAELREGATLCRKGGDEFVAILPDARRDQAEQAAERLSVRVSEYVVPDTTLRLGLSVGVATFPDDSQDGAELQDVADRKMYLNKAGRKGELSLVGHSEEESTRERRT